MIAEAATAARDDEPTRAAAWASIISKVSAFNSAAHSPGAAASRADPYAALERYRAEVSRRLPAEFLSDGGAPASEETASAGACRSRADPAKQTITQRSAQLHHERVHEDFVRTRAMARFESRTRGGFG